MSRFDPGFSFFQNSSGYRNVHTDHEAKFRAFKKFVCDGEKEFGFKDSFVMQFVCHPNFAAGSKTVTYYTYNPTSGEFERSDSMPQGFKRANSFKNYKSSGGHPKGLFYEVNLYTSDGRSGHHTSRVSGSNFPREQGHDQQHGITKGSHWLEWRTLIDSALYKYSCLTFSYF